MRPPGRRTRGPAPLDPDVSQSEKPARIKANAVMGLIGAHSGDRLVKAVIPNDQPSRTTAPISMTVTLAIRGKKNLMGLVFQFLAPLESSTSPDR